MRQFIPLTQQQPQQPNQFAPLPQQQAPEQHTDLQGVSNQIASQLKPSIEVITNGQARPEDVFMKWFNSMNRQQKNCLKKAMNTGLVKNLFKSFGVSEANYDMAFRLINNSN